MSELQCGWCKDWYEEREIVNNWGLCVECFDAMPCPCDDWRPEDCPVHGPEGRNV